MASEPVQRSSARAQRLDSWRGGDTVGEVGGDFKAPLCRRHSKQACVAEPGRSMVDVKADKLCKCTATASPASVA